MSHWQALFFITEEKFFSVKYHHSDKVLTVANSSGHIFESEIKWIEEQMWQKKNHRTINNKKYQYVERVLFRNMTPNYWKGDSKDTSHLKRDQFDRVIFTKPLQTLCGLSTLHTD